ncbi:hypothetical protein D3C78_1995310 [compost metagenome]
MLRSRLEPVWASIQHTTNQLIHPLCGGKVKDAFNKAGINKRFHRFAASTRGMEH